MIIRRARSSRSRGFVAALVLVLALALTLVPSRLGADDFSFHEPSARAAALGGAFTALADDASALFYNPAGLAFLGGFRLKTNIAFGTRTTTAAWPDGAPGPYRTAPSEFLGSIGVSWQPLKRVTIGTGLFSPYNYESYWTPGWSGETLNERNRVRSLYFRSVVAVEVVKGFALSAGVDVVSSSLRWLHTIPFDIPNYPLARAGRYRQQSSPARQRPGLRGRGPMAGRPRAPDRGEVPAGRPRRLCGHGHFQRPAGYIRRHGPRSPSAVTSRFRSHRFLLCDPGCDRTADVPSRDRRRLRADTHSRASPSISTSCGTAGASSATGSSGP